MAPGASATDSRHLVVMGVAGVGKSTVAQRLAQDLGMVLAEGDEFHPSSNVTKMAQGIPLTDEDRWPWLEALADWTRTQRDEGRSTVLTCSALRKAYRDVLRRADAETFFVHLDGPEEVIAERMRDREHFMPVSLLRSQFETLEALADDERGVVADVTATVDAIVADVVAALP